LAHGSAGGEAEHILPNGRISGHKVESGGQLTRRTSDVHAEPFTDTSSYKPRADN
jgi:hypothetical protein